MAKIIYIYFFSFAPSCYRPLPNTIAIIPKFKAASTPTYKQRSTECLTPLMPILCVFFYINIITSTETYIFIPNLTEISNRCHIKQLGTRRSISKVRYNMGLICSVMIIMQHQLYKRYLAY